MSYRRHPLAGDLICTSLAKTLSVFMYLSHEIPAAFGAAYEEPQSGCLDIESKQIQPLTITSNARRPSSSISTLSHTLSCPSMFRAVASD